LVELPGTKIRGESWREKERRHERRHSQPLRAGTKISLLSQDCNREQPQKPDGKSLFLFTVELALSLYATLQNHSPRKFSHNWRVIFGDMCRYDFLSFHAEKGLRGLLQTSYVHNCESK
jgi:hypothetical protein